MLTSHYFCIQPLPQIDMQITSVEKKLESFREIREKLRKGRESAEEAYRAKVTKFLTANEVKLKIEDAYESAQKPKLLQAIHAAHEEVVANDSTVNNTKQELAALHDNARACDTHIASLEAELQPKAHKVLAHLFTHMQSCCLC